MTACPTSSKINPKLWQAGQAFPITFLPLFLPAAEFLNGSSQIWLCMIFKKSLSSLSPIYEFDLMICSIGDPLQLGLCLCDHVCLLYIKVRVFYSIDLPLAAGSVILIVIVN